MANESKTADEPKIEELDKLIAKGKQKGFLTYDEVNDALPSDLVTLASSRSEPPSNTEWIARTPPVRGHGNHTCFPFGDWARTSTEE